MLYQSCDEEKSAQLKYIPASLKVIKPYAPNTPVASVRKTLLPPRLLSPLCPQPIPKSMAAPLAAKRFSANEIVDLYGYRRGGGILEVIRYLQAMAVALVLPHRRERNYPRVVKRRPQRYPIKTNASQVN